MFLFVEPLFELDSLFSKNQSSWFSYFASGMCEIKDTHRILPMVIDELLFPIRSIIDRTNLSSFLRASTKHLNQSLPVKLSCFTQPGKVAQLPRVYLASDSLSLHFSYRHGLNLNPFTGHFMHHRSVCTYQLQLRSGWRGRRQLQDMLYLFGLHPDIVRSRAFRYPPRRCFAYFHSCEILQLFCRATKRHPGA